MVREVWMAVVERVDLAGRRWAIVEDAGRLWAALTPDMRPGDLDEVNAALRRRGALGLDASGCSAIVDFRSSPAAS